MLQRAARVIIDIEVMRLFFLYSAIDIYVIYRLTATIRFFIC